MLPYSPHMKFIICHAMQGHVCILNTVLYPLEKFEWCVYAPFIIDHRLINAYCLDDVCTHNVNLAINDDGYIWVVSSWLLNIFISASLRILTYKVLYSH